jgi:hypothetical protein
MRMMLAVNVTACILFSTTTLANAQLFGGTLGHVLNQVPVAREVNRGAGEVVKAVDTNVTQPVVKGIDHGAHEVGKVADGGLVSFDKNVTQPTAEGVKHFAHEAGKTADQGLVGFDKNVTQPAVAAPKHLLGEVGNGLNHFGGELDKSIFQPIGRGWTHFWHELDVIGNAKEAGHELIADADGRAAKRIDQVAAQANGLVKSSVSDFSTLLKRTMLWLFAALSGAGLIVAVAFRFRKPALIRS